MILCIFYYSLLLKWKNAENFREKAIKTKNTEGDKIGMTENVDILVLIQYLLRSPVQKSIYNITINRLFLFRFVKHFDIFDMILCAIFLLMSHIELFLSICAHP